MAAMRGKLAVVSLMVICMILSENGEAAMSCSAVINAIYPCYDYVMNGGKVPEGCCNGIKSINNAAKTKSDRQSVCNCLQSMAKGVGGMNIDNISSLPTKCGVDVPYKISLNMDCSKVV